MEGSIVTSHQFDVWTAAKDAPDAQLVAEARRGDHEAFAVLYHRYKLDVWNLAWFTLRDHHDAEDAVQDTFLKAHRALGAHRDGPIRPWLLAICRNTCRDRLRTRGRRDVLALDDEMAVASSVDGDHDRRIDLLRALAALPEQEREAFLLVDVLGCHSDEAAQIVGVRAPSTLRSRLARARRTLAPVVEEQLVDSSGAAKAEPWGLYHSDQHSVLVLSFGTNGHGAEAVDELLAGLRGTPNGSDVASGDLLAFLDGVDRRIPESRPVLALVDAQPVERAAVAVPWLAGHPRWRMQRAPTHALWLGEVEHMLAGCAPCTAEDRDRVRAALTADTPFMWMGGR